MHYFDKSPHMVPLLVRLHESHALSALVKDHSPQARSELLGAMVDLMATKLSYREEEILADLLVDLVSKVEMDLRRNIAKRLATLENVPLRLVLHLINEDISIASPMLKSSPLLCDADLMYIIKSKGSEYWQAIAAREGLSDKVIDMLAATKDIDTAITLSGNERIILTVYAVDILSNLAVGNNDLAMSMLLRNDITPEIKETIYGYVGKELQTYIAEHTAGFSENTQREIKNHFDDVIGFFVEPKTQKVDLPISVMMHSLKQGEIERFIEQFSQHSGLDQSKIHSFLANPCVKGLALACRAFGFSKIHFTQIYMLTHRMRTGGTVLHQHDLREALTYFAKLKPKRARRLLLKTE